MHTVYRISCIPQARSLFGEKNYCHIVQRVFWGLTDKCLILYCCVLVPIFCELSIRIQFSIRKRIIMLTKKRILTRHNVGQ